MNNPETYRVVYVEPGKPACEKQIGRDLESLQAAVGGGLIECVYSHTDETILVCNDEGKLLGMEGNRRISTGDILAGPFFVIGTEGENFRSLTNPKGESDWKISTIKGILTNEKYCGDVLGQKTFKENVIGEKSRRITASFHRC